MAAQVKISKAKRTAAIKALGLDPTGIDELWIGRDEVHVHRNQQDGTTQTESLPIS